jgi:hypothetical protein
MGPSGGAIDVQIRPLWARDQRRIAEKTVMMVDSGNGWTPGGPMAPVAEVSPPPVPAEAFERFPGRWIAVRDGEIVADALTIEELEASPRVETADTFVRVPEPNSKFL